MATLAAYLRYPQKRKITGPDVDKEVRAESGWCSRLCLPGPLQGQKNFFCPALNWTKTTVLPCAVSHQSAKSFVSIEVEPFISLLFIWMWNDNNIFEDSTETGLQYRDALTGGPQVVWKWGGKGTFSYLQKVKKTQFFHQISHNLEPTFSSIPVQQFGASHFSHLFETLIHTWGGIAQSWKKATTEMVGIEVMNSSLGNCETSTGIMPRLFFVSNQRWVCPASMHIHNVLNDEAKSFQDKIPITFDISTRL